jgi:hypothetical protein
MRMAVSVVVTGIAVNMPVLVLVPRWPDERS